MTAAVLASLAGAAPPVAEGDRAGRPVPALNRLWNAYGDAGGHWTGGDCASSVPLPDGRIVWLFCDTFLGTVNPDHSRPASSPLIRNAIVVQQGNALTTRHGGTPETPRSLIGPTGAGVGRRWYWPGDGVVENDRLCVFYTRVLQHGPGGWDFRTVGTGVGCLSLPGLVPVEFTLLPVSGAVSWGKAVLTDGGYTYVYGVEEPGPAKYLHLARARAGALTGPWEFFTGSGWSRSEAASARLLHRIGHGFSVDRVGSRYVLVTAQLSGLVVGYSAARPEGPFGGKRRLYSPPEIRHRRDRIAYDARAHPELSGPDRLVISYNVNSLVQADALRDARIYRPRFIEVPRKLLEPTGSGMHAADISGNEITDSRYAPRVAAR